MVALLPEAVAGRADFVSTEFENPEDIGELIAHLEASEPGWRVLSICHIEDLPLLMGDPDTPIGGG